MREGVQALRSMEGGQGAGAQEGELILRRWTPGPIGAVNGGAPVTS